MKITLAPSAPGGGIDGSDRRPGVVNYYAGADRTRWRQGIPTFGRVHYRDLRIPLRRF